MPLRLVSSIDFFLGIPYETTYCATGETVPFARCTIRGPRTCKKTFIKIGSGVFTSFSIRFQPAGLYRLLGIPAVEFRDEAIDATLIQPQLFDELVEQLMLCTDIKSCIRVAEPFLLRLANSNKHAAYRCDAVEQLAGILGSSLVPPRIRTAQETLCLSLRQLERNFMKEVGVTPKLYSRMARFTNLLNYKNRFPDNSWASLAYEFDYADQMHLVKDFRSFLGVNPTAFRADDFAF